MVKESNLVDTPTALISLYMDNLQPRVPGIWNFFNIASRRLTVNFKKYSHCSSFWIKHIYLQESPTWFSIYIARFGCKWRWKGYMGKSKRRYYRCICHAWNSRRYKKSWTNTFIKPFSDVIFYFLLNKLITIWMHIF